MAGNSDELRFLWDIGEESVIEKYILPLLSPPEPGEHLEPGDDARDILPRGYRVLIAHDGYTIELLRLPWRTMSDIGYAAVVGVLSDIVAKGGVPAAVTVSLGLSREMRVSELKQLVHGVLGACNTYRVRYMGGDVNLSNDPWISVAALGFTSAARPPKRGGAQPGDVIIATGVYGAMGVIAVDGVPAAEKYPWIMEATQTPRLHIEVGYVIATHYSSITSSMDVSDGLAYTLYTMSRLSGHTFLLTSPPRYYPELEDYCRREVVGQETSKCVLHRVMSGGEEYGVVMTVKKERLVDVEDMLAKLHVPYRVIGRVTEGAPGVYLETQSGERTKIPISRWDQFSGWKQL